MSPDIKKYFDDSSLNENTQPAFFSSWEAFVLGRHLFAGKGSRRDILCWTRRRFFSICATANILNSAKPMKNYSVSANRSQREQSANGD